MARRAIDQIPQSILVHELRRAIDVARNSNEETATWEMAVGRIVQLCRENPHSALRTHVLHNLGCGRRHWLRQLAAKVPDAPLDPTPNVYVEGEYRRMRSLHEQLTYMGKCDRRGVAMAAESPAT